MGRTAPNFPNSLPLVENFCVFPNSGQFPAPIQLLSWLRISTDSSTTCYKLFPFGESVHYNGRLSNTLERWLLDCSMLVGIYVSWKLQAHG